MQLKSFAVSNATSLAAAELVPTQDILHKVQASRTALTDHQQLKPQEKALLILVPQQQIVTDSPAGSGTPAAAAQMPG